MSRQAILVLGPHRAGTSAVAGLLVRLGVQAPRTLMPANTDNPAGYWESDVLCEFHERLLRAAGSRWDDFTPLDLNRLPADAAGALEDECRRKLREEFGGAPCFVLKDPRVCRFVPFWLRILAGEHIAPAGILVLRSPGEVVRSLAARNRFGADLSLLMWLRHVLDAERDTRGIRRTFVPYRDLLARWESIAEQIARDLGLPAARSSAVAGRDVAQFVNPGLCHHPVESDVSDVPPLVSNWARTAWIALASLAGGDPSQTGPALATLDRVRSELDQHTSVGGIADRMYRALRTRIDDLEEAQRATQEHAVGLERQRDELRGRVVALEHDVGVLRHEVSTARSMVDALRSSASWRVTAPLRAIYRLLR